MDKIKLKDSQAFAQFSGDKNQIHINNKISENYFFRKSIVHGVNLSILGFIKFLKKKNLKIKNAKINFLNYCINEEIFSISPINNSIYIKGENNNKIKIDLNLGNKIEYKSITKTQKKILKFYNLNKKFFSNLNFLEHLIFISKKVGNFFFGANTLIHSIILKENKLLKISKKSFVIKRIVKNIYLLKINYLGYESDTIFSKLTKIKFDLNKFNLSKKILKKIKNKKIIIFGISSDVSKAVQLCVRKAKVQIFKYSLTNKNINKSRIKKFILNKKPEFIFFFSSPKVLSTTQVNKSNFQTYYEVYYKKFKIILDILNNNKLKTKVFYPSTFALNKPKTFLRLKNYLRAKQIGEKLCLKHKHSRYIKIFRLPAFKSRSNYNMLGYYEGESLYNIKKYLTDFFGN